MIIMIMIMMTMTMRTMMMMMIIMIVIRPGKRIETKLWKVKTRVVPIVIGPLGTIPKG